MNENKLDSNPDGLNPYLDPATTLALAHASLAAYSDFEGKTFRAPENYKLVGRFTGWDELYWIFGIEERFGLIFQYIGPEKNVSRFIVAFRGTDSLTDVYEDTVWAFAGFKPFRNPLPTAPNVCQGFYNIYATKGDIMARTMQKQIFDMLERLNPSEVLITGHSLGGALSQLFTLDMKLSMPNVSVQTINFASPQVGDTTWQTACDNAGATNAITRVINIFDLVPDGPFEIDGYVSIGEQFETAFFRLDLFAYNPLSEHSMVNLHTVLKNCVHQNPQVWDGIFDDAVDQKYKMVSFAPPESDAIRQEYIAKIRELADIRRKAISELKAA